MSQLIADLDLVMQIPNKGCVIQNRLTRSLTGAGELRDGLYFFRRMTSFYALKLSKEGADEVWHQRLGHPSNTVFDLLQSVGCRGKDFRLVMYMYMLNNVVRVFTLVIIKLKQFLI